jgi:hypothetical protein
VTRQLHAAAVLTRLAAATGTPAAVVYDGKVPDAVPGTPSAQVYYVVRFEFRKLTASDGSGVTSLTFDSTTQQVDVTVHSVGTDARSTRGVAQRAETQLLNWTPTVTGRTCTPLRQVESVTLAPNEAMGVAVEQQSDSYRFISVPA